MSDERLEQLITTPEDADRLEQLVGEKMRFSNIKPSVFCEEGALRGLFCVSLEVEHEENRGVYMPLGDIEKFLEKQRNVPKLIRVFTKSPVIEKAINKEELLSFCTFFSTVVGCTVILNCWGELDLADFLESVSVELNYDIAKLSELSDTFKTNLVRLGQDDFVLLPLNLALPVRQIDYLSNLQKGLEKFLDESFTFNIVISVVSEMSFDENIKKDLLNYLQVLNDFRVRLLL